MWTNYACCPSRERISSLEIIVQGQSVGQDGDSGDSGGEFSISSVLMLTEVGSSDEDRLLFDE